MDATVMRLAFVLALLTGCMKIYPDSEQPDLHVHWDEDDCRPETPSIKLVLSHPDGSLVEERVLPCGDLEATFVDLMPARYELRSWLLLDDGEPFSSWYSEHDMRDAFSDDEYLYFGGGGNFRVAWTFSMDATCKSLGADYILFELEWATGTTTGQNQFTAPCDPSPYVGYANGDMIMLQLRAVDFDTFTVRAISDVVGPFSAQPDTLTNAGTITLTPCTSCD